MTFIAFCWSPHEKYSIISNLKKNRNQPQQKNIISELFFLLYVSI